jgi:hypothetical protein
MKRSIFKRFLCIPLLMVAPQLWSADDAAEGIDLNDPAAATPEVDADPLEPNPLADDSPLPDDHGTAPEAPTDAPTFADDAVVFEVPALPEDEAAAAPSIAEPTKTVSPQAPSAQTPAPQQPQTFTIAKQEIPTTAAPDQPKEEEVDECPITEDIEPLRPDIELSQNLLFILLAAFLCAILGFVLYRLLHRKKPKQRVAVQTAAPVVKDPLQEALLLLKEAKRLLENTDAKPFAFALTDAVRPYLSYVFALPAPECTTEEMLVKLPGCTKLSDILRTHIADLLTACDLIKFSPMTFDIDASTNLYQTAETIIQLSTQRHKELIEEERQAALAAKAQQEAQQKAALKEKISTIAGFKSASTAAKPNAKAASSAATENHQNPATNSNQRKQ